jgi:L-amino acid N-acyltransferase YncA
MNIRKYQDADWVQLWPILKNVFQAGETFVFSPDITKEEAYKVWVELPQDTYVALDQDNKILGTFYFKPNQPGLGSHVVNCGYIVAEAARGKGVASNMCKHAQSQALALGFKAMQYNFVVSTNERAIRLWKKHGFHIVGNLPNAFNSKRYGYIDALVMYKELK